jgi:hypothetical protein
VSNYIEKVEEISTDELYDCHVRVIRNFLAVNGIRVNEGLLFLISERITSIFINYSVYGIELFSIIKAPICPFFKIVENLKLNLIKIADKDLVNEKSLMKFVDKNQNFVFLYDEAVLFKGIERDDKYFYFKNVSAAMLLGYDNDKFYADLVDEEGKLKTFTFTQFQRSRMVKIVPVSPKEKTYLLKKLNKSEIEYLNNKIFDIAKDALIRSCKAFLYNKLSDLDFISEKRIDFDRLKYSHIKRIDVAGGYKSFDAFIDALLQLKEELSYEKNSKEIMDKLFIYKIHTLYTRFQISHNFEYMQFYNALIEFNKIYRNKDLEDTCNNIYELVCISRQAIRLIGNYKFFINKKITYLDKICNYFKILKEKQKNVMEQILLYVN